MNKAFSPNFIFATVQFENYHHTDNRAGSPQHYIAYMQKGNSKIVSDGATIEIKAGDVFYIPKGLPYQSYWRSENEIIFKSFGFDLFIEGNSKDYILQKIECSDEVISKLTSISTNTAVTTALLGEFYVILSEILPNMKYRSYNRKKMILEKAKEYIFSHTDCKVSDIARHCLISESSLYELFKKEAATTPNGMRQRVLCEKAVMLLSTTDRSVQDISDSLGFSSTSYFRKQLKKHLCKTPREIRAAALSL